MHVAGGRHTRVELDFTEGVFVAGDVLLQESQQSLGLLRAEVDALKIANLYLALGLLLESAEGEEEIPDIDAHLHAVGVRLAIVGGVSDFDVGLRWESHNLAV